MDNLNQMELFDSLAPQFEILDAQGRKLALPQEHRHPPAEHLVKDSTERSLSDEEDTGAGENGPRATGATPDELPAIDLWISSCGLGAQSMYQSYIGAMGAFPCQAIVTADTGAELDRLASNGERYTAGEFFEAFVAPLAALSGIPAYFVRACNAQGAPLPSLEEHIRQRVAAGKLRSIWAPVFGNKGGRLKQSCTDHIKVRAIYQISRALGATRMCSAIGLHLDEAVRRMKGARLQVVEGRRVWCDVLGTRDGKPVISRRYCHHYPLVDLGLVRAEIRDRCKRIGVVYLESSECDFCPHQNKARWLRLTAARQREIAALEASMTNAEGDRFTFTPAGLPLLKQIAIWQSQQSLFAPPEEDGHGCGSICDL